MTPNHQTTASLQSLSDLMRGREWPTLRQAMLADAEAVLALRIPAGLIWFQGHFPDQPVLPGVVQVHWAAKLSAIIFAGLPGFSSMSNLKFKTMITPELDVDLSLQLKRSERRANIVFSYQGDALVYSSGSVVFSLP